MTEPVDDMTPLADRWAADEDDPGYLVVDDGETPEPTAED